MKIACLVTGAPRTFERCAPTLKRYLRFHDADYFLCYRDENSDQATDAAIKLAYQPVHTVVTTVADTDAFKDHKGPLSRKFIQMWHEVFVGAQAIAAYPKTYDLCIRVRFDAFFGENVLADLPGENEVCIPDFYSYLGVNDMFAVARPATFFRYANLYQVLRDIMAKSMPRTPELLVLSAMQHLCLTFRASTASFGLIRPWYSTVSDTEYGEMLHTMRDAVLSKFETFGKDPDSLHRRVSSQRAAIKRQAAFPLNIPHRAADASTESFWMPTEHLDTGTPIRWFLNQAYMRRVIDHDHVALEFDIIHAVRGVDPTNPDHFAVWADEAPLTPEFHESNIGRYHVRCSIPASVRARAPSTRLAFWCPFAVVHSESEATSTGNRLLSVAITEPMLMAA